MLCLSAAQSKAILACHRANFSLMMGGWGVVGPNVPLQLSKF